MTVFQDEFINPNDPGYQAETKMLAELTEKMKDPRVVKQMWHDYEYKKGQAFKYFRMYENFKIKNNDDLKGSETLLKKAEKWASKAQAVLDKFAKRNEHSNNGISNNLSSELHRDL